MGYVDIRNFVDINIVNKVVTQIDSTREAVVLFTLNTTIAPVATLYNIYNSLEEVEETGINKNTNSYKYAKVYFENGGIKLVCVNINYGNSGEPYEFYTPSNILPFVKELPNEYIIIAVEETNNWDLMAELASTYNASTIDGKAVYGVKWKIFLTNMLYTSGPQELPALGLDAIENFCIKLTDTTNQVGGEMTIAAYLNQIDFYANETVQDYDFTPEKLSTTLFDTLDMNTYVSTCIQYHANISVKLNNVVRNIGGDLANGENLVNKFALIVLHQTLSQVVFNTLTQKLKGKDAITALYGTISQELNKYVNDGYLTLDKIWTNQSVIVTKNGINYTLIEKGTPLVKGYYISILPYSSLTAEELAAHKCPDIYVFIADNYTIRKVTINGKVGGSIA